MNTVFVKVLYCKPFVFMNFTSYKWACLIGGYFSITLWQYTRIAGFRDGISATDVALP